MRRRGGRRIAAAAAGVAPVGLLATTGYLAVLAAAATASARRHAHDPVPPPVPMRVAVLVPAHDEAAVIADTVAHLRRLDHPAGLLELHVIADHCRDDTAALARAAGAVVHERADPEPAGKGPSLQWLIDHLAARREPPEVYVFVDADTAVAPDFLRHALPPLAAGAPAVQGRYDVRDPEAAPLVAFRAAAFAVRAALRPLGRTALGGSAGLHGNGMAFRADALRDRTWSAHLTEDAELAVELSRDGARVAYAARARVAAEMPDTLDAARSQHERWERGRVQLLRAHLPGLVRQLARGPHRGLAADAAADLAVPPLSVLVLATGGWGAWTLAARALGIGSTRAVVAAAATGLTQAGVVASALVLTDAPPAVARSLVLAPRLVAWKAALWARQLTGPGPAAWVRTSRNRPAPGAAPAPR